jgi:hypothetical protein
LDAESEEDLDALDALAEAAAGSASDDEKIFGIGNTGAAAQAEIPAESDGEGQTYLQGRFA